MTLLLPRLQAGGRAWWLVDVQLGGQVFRWSTEVLTVSRRDGSTVPYRPGLARGLTVSLRGMSDLALTIADPADWSALRARGIPSEGGRVEVRRWWPGQALEDARVVLRGSVRDLRLGSAGEGLSLRATPDTAASTTSAQLPSEGARITATSTTSATTVTAGTWPVSELFVPEKGIGTYYPEIIGYPGDAGAGNIAYDAVPVAFCEASPASADKRLLIAGHRCEAASVRVKDPTDERPFAGETVATETLVDAMGRTVTTVELESASSMTLDLTAAYAVGFSASNGGGRMWRGRVLRGAGDLISWVHETYARGAPLDRGRHEAIAGQLNAYKIDAYINSPMQALDWLQKAALSWLPVLKVAGPDGYYWRPLIIEPERGRARRHLSADRGQVVRLGSSVAGEEVANEVTVEYGRARASTKGYKSRTVTAEAGRLADTPTWYGLVADDERVLPSWHAATSRSLYGVQPLSIQAQTYDDTTALLVAQRQVMARWTRRQGHRYSGAAIDLEDLEVEDLVLVSDDDVNLSEACCAVVDVILGEASTEVELVVVDEPLAGRQRRTT